MITKTMTICLTCIFGLFFVASAQSFKKEIRVKKTITGNDTIVEYDTIIEKGDYFDEEAFKSYWKKMEKDIESAVAPYQDVDRFEEEWRQSMLYLDSIEEKLDFDFDMDMDIRPPSYTFYFNDGKDSIRHRWNFYDWQDFEKEMQNHFKQMTDVMEKYFGSAKGYMQKQSGEISKKIMVENTGDGKYEVILLEPLTLHSIKVYNDVGSTVFYRHYSGGQTMEKIKLDLSMENPGGYFVKIDAEEGTYLKRLVIP